MGMLRHIWEFRPVWLTPLVFLIPCFLLVDNDTDEMNQIKKCAYGLVVMAVLWLTETLPIPVTSLIPIFLFPMLGVATAKEMSGAYVTDTTMLFLGGLIVAVAIEESNLHRRISLCVMMIVGTHPALLMLGLTLTTWFLSMWISNTAASSMMVPIFSAVIKTMEEINDQSVPEAGESNLGYEMGSTELQNGDEKTSSNSGRKYEVTSSQVSVTSVKPMSKSEMSRLAKGFALVVAYGANVGGIATLTGTPPNLVLKNKADDLYVDWAKKHGMKGISESPITFAKWMGFAFPLSLICVFIGWIWLSLLFLRGGVCRRQSPVVKAAISDTIKKQFRQLGRITLAELSVLIVFVILIVLWLFRKPPNIDGWGTGFEPGYVSDSTPCMLFGVLLFILPAKKPNLLCWADPELGGPSYTPILTWKAAVNKLPWGVIILLGGGFALAKACLISGFSDWVGKNLESFSNQETWVMNLIICIIVAALTELTSNTATATLLMPILATLAISTEIHPLYLMMSSTIACSFAFMLPVATPPNAIVFSTGYVTIFDMFIAGLPMNIFALASLTLAINTWGVKMFELETFPSMFLEPNVTTV